MQNRVYNYLIIVLYSLLILGICLIFLFVYLAFRAPSATNTPYNTLLPVEIENVLQKKISLMQKLLDNKTIIQSVITATQNHQHLSRSKIWQLDKNWHTASKNYQLIKQITDNDCAKILKQFKAEHPEFAEIVVTDQNGLNVCATNKTSNYYQGDKAWWQKAYAFGGGRIYYGPIEFDTSANTIAIAIYVPISDQQNYEVLGIGKGVIAVEAIKKEL